jgi:hypothetical protein
LATLFERASSGVRSVSRPAYRRRAGPVDAQGSTDAPTWFDYQLDLVGGRSDAPRVPARQLELLYPEGAPRSWELLVERPRRPVWVVRAAGAVISVVLGAVALLSPAVASVAATIGVGLGELASLVGHALAFIDVGGALGVIGRAAALIAVAVPLTRLGWRAARWGVAPIGDDR